MMHLVLNSLLGSRIRILELLSLDFDFSQGFTKYILTYPSQDIGLPLPHLAFPPNLFHVMTTNNK